MKETVYNEASIQILEGLEAVRKRPGMYIGDTTSKGLHHLAWEIIDNAIDEALAGFCDNIIITINSDGSLTVFDNGRGIPVGLHSSGLSTPEIIFTKLHAGGKFNNSSYKVSGGLHGVGASVVNALSTKFEATIYRDKNEYYLSFKDGGKLNQALKKGPKTTKTGVEITFWPDYKNFFHNTRWEVNTFIEHLRESAFLIPQLNLTLNDHTTNKTWHFHYDEGMKAFITYLTQNKPVLTSASLFESIKDGIKVAVALCYLDDYQEHLISFVNNVRTNDGGTHVAGFRAGLSKAINDYARKIEFLKAKDDNFDSNDLREGLCAIISLQIPEQFIQFEGQTKAKLGTSKARGIVETIVNENFTFWLFENAAEAKKILEKAQKARDIRQALRKQKDHLRNKNKAEIKNQLIGKLTPARKHNKDKNELFLVEGDSAGGTAKMGRDSAFQAILPLLGKVINAEKANLENLLQNNEIQAIINTIGASVGDAFNLKHCNYHKIIIMTDADDDGAHIQILLLTFFYRMMLDLITAGKIFIALPPLFAINYKLKGTSQQQYAWDETELAQITAPLAQYEVQRYKGLGEMNYDQLWTTTMNPQTRKIVQVTIDDALKAEESIDILMGNKPEKRKIWIQNNIDFDKKT